MNSTGSLKQAGCIFHFLWIFILYWVYADMLICSLSLSLCFYPLHILLINILMCRHMFTYIPLLVQVQVWAVLPLCIMKMKCNVVCKLERAIKLCPLLPETFGWRDFIAAFKKSLHPPSFSYNWEIIQTWSGFMLALMTVIHKNDKKQLILCWL